MWWPVIGDNSLCGVYCSASLCCYVEVYCKQWLFVLLVYSLSVRRLIDSGLCKWGNKSNNNSTSERSWMRSTYVILTGEQSFSFSCDYSFIFLTYEGKAIGWDVSLLLVLSPRTLALSLPMDFVCCSMIGVSCLALQSLTCRRWYHLVLNLARHWPQVYYRFGLCRRWRCSRKAYAPTKELLQSLHAFFPAINNQL